MNFQDRLSRVKIKPVASRTNFRAVKKTVLDLFEFTVDIFINFVNILYYLIKLRLKWSDFVKHSSFYIFSVILSVMVISIAQGVVIGVQIGPEFVSRGIGNKLGILTAITMTRELIPVLGCMMIATQYGTGLASEVATMKISEQIDALKIFKVNPVYYIAVPRFLAAVIFTPLIIWLASLVAIISGYLTIWLKTELSLQGFLGSIWDYFLLSDIGICLFKSSIYGALIVLVAVTKGFETRGGAKAVGQATTLTVILSFVFIVILDYVISFIYL